MALLRSIRIALILAATASFLAIQIGRANPERPARRTRTAANQCLLNKYYSEAAGEACCDFAGRGARLLDVETGRLEMLPPMHRHLLDRASLSPWEESGRRQVIGLESCDSMVAMVRLALPGGETLDQVGFADLAVPSSAPSWFPGTLARVLYAGADGQIYRLDFETTRPDGVVVGVPEARPRALSWRAPVFSGGEVTVCDLSWPEDARMGGRLFASLFRKDAASRSPAVPQLWWLELDRDATSIVAAGPLLEPSPAGEGDELRLPNLVIDGDGAASLAYLARTGGRRGHQLRVTPIDFDPDSRIPRAREAEARVLALGCISSTLIAAHDGSWLTVSRRDGPAVRLGQLATGPEATLSASLPLARVGSIRGRRSASSNAPPRDPNLSFPDPTRRPDGCRS